MRLGTFAPCGQRSMAKPPEWETWGQKWWAPWIGGDCFYAMVGCRYDGKRHRLYFDGYHVERAWHAEIRLWRWTAMIGRHNQWRPE